MKSKRIIQCIIVIVAVFLCTYLSTPAKASPDPNQIVWKMADFHAPTHVVTQLISEFLPVFEKATAGKLKIKFFPSGALTSNTDTPAAIQKGICDLAVGSIPQWATIDPVFKFCHQGIEFRDLKGFADACDNGVQDILNETFAEHRLGNIKIAKIVPAGFLIMGFKNKEVRVPQDIKGLKIITWGKAYVEQLVAWGAHGIVLPFDDMYQGIMTGMGDGITGCAAHWVDWKFMEGCSYGLKGIHQGAAQNALLVSKKSLDKLPGDIKPIVEILINELGERMRLTFYRVDSYYLDYIMPQYMKLYTPTKQEAKLWKEPMGALVNAWVKEAGLRGKRVLDIVREHNK
jgi:C4-dicarboxylate-binding protein DctP